MKKILFLGSMIVLLNKQNVFSQSTPDQTVYPKLVGYMSFILPIIKVNKNETATNFSNSFSIGFPVGMNVFYSDKFGFSYEITPTVKYENGNSKMSNLLFDPGLIFRFKHGFAFVSRLAFETSGRYGVTPLVTKVINGGEKINYFISVSVPLRVGNTELPTIGGNMQLGLIFK